MSLSTLVRIIFVTAAVIICAASGGPHKTSGGFATQKQVVFYTTKPKFEWPHQRGATYRVVLWRLPNPGQPAPQVPMWDQQNYTERTWIPPEDLGDLDFETKYALFVYNDRQQVVSSWGFAIGFQPPQVQGVLAQKNAKVRNLSPQIRVKPFEYPNVWIKYEVSESPSFEATKIIDSGYVAQREETIQRFPGPDNQSDTADDISYVQYNVARVLKPNRTYYWRVRGYYYEKAEDLEDGKKPDPARALGFAEVTGQFTIPPQSGSDSLANITQITRDNQDTVQPTINKRLGLAYVSCKGRCDKLDSVDDIGSDIRVAAVTMRNGTPIYDTGREEFTKSVRGSWDMRPQWDVDGEGIFFDSNRANGVFNVWYKRRDARGYTQITFHQTDAWGPTVSKDGNKVAYRVRNPENITRSSIWIVDRDGRAATELGEGDEPAFSPDGKKIAFSARGKEGWRQIWIMDINGGNRIQLTNEFDNYTPVWHPSGKRIVFVSTRADNPDIWMADLESARMVQLTNFFGDDADPEFTPDGRYLMFASERGAEVHRIWMGELSAATE